MASSARRGQAGSSSSTRALASGLLRTARTRQHHCGRRRVVRRPPADATRESAASIRSDWRRRSHAGPQYADTARAILHCLRRGFTLTQTRRSDVGRRTTRLLARRWQRMDRVGLTSTRAGPCLNCEAEHAIARRSIAADFATARDRRTRSARLSAFVDGISSALLCPDEGEGSDPATAWERLDGGGNSWQSPPVQTP